MRGFYRYVKEHGFPRLTTSYFDADGVANPVMKQIFREVCLQFGSLGPPRSKGYVEPWPKVMFGDYMAMNESPEALAAQTLDGQALVRKELEDILREQYNQHAIACGRLGLTLVRPLEFIHKDGLAGSADPLEPYTSTHGWKATWCN